MDSNLIYWESHGQSFFSRFQVWMKLLDPTSLLASDAELDQAHNILGSGEKRHERDEHATNLSLSSVHADSGAVLPLVFRPPAFLPITTPLVIASFFPHRSVKSALFWQFMLQSYTAGFNLANRNTSSEQNKDKVSLKHLLLATGAVSYTTFAGALPQICINRLGVRSIPIQTFFRSILPIPLSAVLAFFNVLTVRSKEGETGIQVFDFKRNPVGLSKAAGEKAVKETALSRAILFGATVAVYNLMALLLPRGKLFKKNTFLIAPLCHISTVFILGLMIPVSFSLYPQLGTLPHEPQGLFTLKSFSLLRLLVGGQALGFYKIKKENVEKELWDAANDGQLFYHRGL